MYIYSFDRYIFDAGCDSVAFVHRDYSSIWLSTNTSPWPGINTRTIGLIDSRAHVIRPVATTMADPTIV